MIDKELLIKRIRHDSDCWASTEEVYDLVKAVDNIVIWHPYPQEKPTHSGRFEVSFRNPKRANRREVTCAKYVYRRGEFASYTDKIYAWAELPKAYEP